MFSKGYTGQKVIPLRKAEFDITHINSVENWLKLFYKFDFHNFPIFEVTNLFRCELFIIVDSIAFHDWKNLSVSRAD
jgi:hypothetical protein